LDRNGLKKSESGFDTNKTNPFLSISIHFVCWALKCSFKTSWINHRAVLAS